MSRRSTGAGLLAAALVVVGVVGASYGLAAWQPFLDGPPSRWDPRVADLVPVVERLRWHRFSHPVHVEFLDAAAFERTVTVRPDEISSDDRAEIAASEAAMRALGLAGGDDDLLADTNTLSGSGTLAYYQPGERRIVVRGTHTPDAATRVAAQPDAGSRFPTAARSGVPHRARDPSAGDDEQHPVLLAGANGEGRLIAPTQGDDRSPGVDGHVPEVVPIGRPASNAAVLATGSQHRPLR